MRSVRLPVSVGSTAELQLVRNLGQVWG